MSTLRSSTKRRRSASTSSNTTRSSRSSVARRHSNYLSSSSATPLPNTLSSTSSLTTPFLVRKRKRASRCKYYKGPRWALCKASENPTTTAVSIALVTLAGVGIYLSKDIKPLATVSNSDSAKPRKTAATAVATAVPTAVPTAVAPEVAPAVRASAVVPASQEDDTDDDTDEDYMSIVGNQYPILY